MAGNDALFSPMAVAMTEAGESIGRLDETFSRIANYRTSQEIFISKIRTAIIYPTFILCAATAAIFFMLTYVVPKFSSFFNPALFADTVRPPFLAGFFFYLFFKNRLSFPYFTCQAFAEKLTK